MKKKFFLIVFCSVFLPFQIFAVSISPTSFLVGCAFEGNPTCEVSISCDTITDHYLRFFDSNGIQLAEHCDCSEGTQDCVNGTGVLPAGNYVIVEMWWQEGESEICFTDNLANCRLDTGYISETSFSLTEAQAGGQLFTMPSDFASGVFSIMSGTIWDLANVWYIPVGISVACWFIIYFITIFESREKEK